MAQPPGLCLLVLLGLGTGGSASCYDPRGQPRRCMPDFENAAFGRAVHATNTCGSPPEDYCLQMGARHASTLCHRCDASDPQLHHNSSLLTDFHSQEESTWWQSQSMAFGIQHPNSVNITLHLGKAYEITYVRLKFHTSRPESFAIYKRSRAQGPWVPFQFYSASCSKTYGRPQRHFLRPGEDEQVAFCTEEFSDISPLSGGNVAFSTLEGRPSAYNFDTSPVLQEWVTVTDLLVSLNRLNTFGDDIFRDPKVLQSYYYAISDFSVGGRCKCNGHASECAPDGAGQLACVCQHNTAGIDCERCQPFHQDRPWARGTAQAANECLPCNCSGRSDECFYDRELYRRTGHGGHCLNCRDNTAGPHCERCRQNHYRWEQRAACQPCHCHPAGSLQPQCDSSGTCLCKANVTGWKCERCKDGYHSLSQGGCRPCSCDPAGSVGTCDPNTGHCTCKERVEGHLCNRCQPGWFNLQPHNPAGCSSCFCYGHSSACTVAEGYEVTYIRSDFSQGLEGWAAMAPGTRDLPLRWADGEIVTEWDGEELVDFRAPEKFLQNQQLSYGQLLSLLLGVEGSRMEMETETEVPLLQVQLVLEGEGMEVTMSSSESQPQHGKQAVTFRLQEAEEGVEPSLSAFSFRRLLSNLTSLRLRVSRGAVSGSLALSEVRLRSAQLGPGARAGWVEECRCPPGYTGHFCQSCAPGFTREVPFGGPFTSCVPCACNQHGDCHPLTGHCQCLHNTEGASCERCSPGFYGNPFEGHFDDCKPCPCPGGSPCTEMPGTGEVVCTHCPPGQRGKRCELCDDGFFGDPLGQRGPVRPCVPCQCHGNVDPNAVGNCDPVSGRCLRCLHNTTGEQCESCRPGFYGDALAPDPAGKCAPCDCNPNGSAPGLEGCDPGTGQCHCLPHVMGRTCGLCQPGYYGLQPAVGCQSCECHPRGSREPGCQAVTGQCSCQPGVTGRQCDRCHHGFFGFSARGCRACNCSPLGSITLQCHENSTCLCHPGFVGYKCDQCQANFFLAPRSSRCQQCPACYGLVKDEAAQLKARLQEMEEWLRKPGCDARPGQFLLLGDAPRGDGLPSPHLLQGARAALLAQAGWLAGALGTAQDHLSNASRATSCSGHGPSKTCALLWEVGATLQSAQQELLHAADTLATMEIPQELPQLPTSWSRRALEARALAESQEDTVARVEAVVGRALRASNASCQLLQSLLEGSATAELETGYEEMQRAQEELGAGVVEVAAEARRAFTAVQQENADMAKKRLQVAALGQQAVPVQAGALAQELAALELAVDALEPSAREAVEVSQALAARLRQELQRTGGFQQLQDRAGSAHGTATLALSHGKAVLSDTESLLTSLEGMRKVLGHRKGQAALRRRMALVRSRALVEAQRKIKQAERALGSSLSVSTAAQRTAREAEQASGETTKRAQVVLQQSKQGQQRARQLARRANQTRLELSRQQREAQKLSRDLEEALQVGTEVSEMARSLQQARGSLLSDIETLNNLLSSLGELEQPAQAEVVLSAGQLELARLWQRLGTPGALAGQLSLLQEEAERQQEKIQALERDLAEIRADKKNLEDILRSLPEGCSKGQ